MTTSRTSPVRSHQAGLPGPRRGSNVTPLVRPQSRDEMAPASVQGTLALDLDTGLEPPWVTAAPPTRGADVIEVSAAVRRDLQNWVHTFTQACVEVIGGARPVSQLVRWTTPAIHNELAYRAGVISRASVHRRGHRSGGRPSVRPQVQTVRTCFLGEDVVEFSARVRHGERSRFIAGRLEVICGRWQATALEFG